MKFQLQGYCDRCRSSFMEGQPICIQLPHRIYLCYECAKNLAGGDTDKQRVTTEYIKGEVVEATMI